MFAWAQIPEKYRHLGSLEFSKLLLEHANVATVTGDAFGNPNCIRISYAASQEQIIEAISRIKAALA